MDFIDNDKCVWNYDKIIKYNGNDLLNLTDNIYLVKNNIVHIFYIKIYNISTFNKTITDYAMLLNSFDSNQRETREEVLFSLYLKRMEDFLDKYDKYYYSKLDERCEFCYEIFRGYNITKLKTSRFSDVIICKNCFLSKKQKNYHVNNTLIKSTDNTNIEMIKKTVNHLIYFYSVKQYYDDFSYIRLLCIRSYYMLNTKPCQFCHRNEKIDPKESIDCYECRKFSLHQYHIMCKKPKYFGLIDDLHADVISVIIKLYITLHDFDKREFINYYDKINKKDVIINIDNSNNLPKNDVNDNYDLIDHLDSDDEYVDPDLINDDDDDNDECDLTNFDDY